MKYLFLLLSVVVLPKCATSSSPTAVNMQPLCAPVSDASCQQAKELQLLGCSYLYSMFIQALQSEEGSIEERDGIEMYLWWGWTSEQLKAACPSDALQQLHKTRTSVLPLDSIHEDTSSKDETL